MNYQHEYHAGSACDVIKHVTLLAALNTLLNKDSAFCYLDTHAGLGEYDLTNVTANKTAEYQSGIARLTHQQFSHPILKKYLQLTADKKRYPGSPLIAESVLREHDEMHLIEKEADVYQTLKDHFYYDKRAHTHHADGYTALNGLIPPKAKRGVVLIDPPYEDKNEFDNIFQCLKHAYKKWPTGIYMMWYPIKARQSIDLFLKQLQRLDLPKMLIAEFCFWPDDVPLRLNGSGMMIINAPWKLNEELNILYAELLPFLQQHPKARFEIKT